MFKYVTFCEILVSNEMDSKYIRMYVLYRCILEVFGVRVKHVTEKKAKLHGFYVQICLSNNF